MQLIFESKHLFLNSPVTKDLLLEIHERIIISFAAHSFFKSLLCYQTLLELSNLPLEVVFKNLLDHRWQVLFNCFYLFLKEINFIR